jgi:hypothetical protein
MTTTHQTPTAPSAAPHPAWGELVTAALLGSERRTPPGGSPTGLLDAAATSGTAPD